MGPLPYGRGADCNLIGDHYTLSVKHGPAQIYGLIFCKA